METRQLTTRRPGRLLRWTRGPRHSVRAYALATQPDFSSCVSTRSTELNVVLDGEMVLEMGPARQIVRVRAGEAALVARGVPHRVRVERPTRFVVVDVDAPTAPALCHLPAEKTPATLLAEVDGGWRKPPGEVLRTLDDAARQLIARMSVGATTDIETASSTRRMEIVKGVLEARFADPPSLGELAAVAKTNEFYLLRSFRKNFGFSPLAYAQFLRTEHFVWELLRPSSLRKLGALSLDAGFGDYSSFERRIRALFGVAPSSLIADEEQPIGPE